MTMRVYDIPYLIHILCAILSIAVYNEIIHDVLNTNTCICIYTEIAYFKCIFAYLYISMKIKLNYYSRYTEIVTSVRHYMRCFFSYD